MLHLFFDEGYWFAPKKYGYGAGWPIKWQGWVFLALHVAIIVGIALFFQNKPVVTISLTIVAALAPLPIYKARTEGGWKWRIDGKDE